MVKSVTPVPHFKRRIYEGLFIITLTAALFLLLALFSFHRSDLVGLLPVQNSGGRAGAWFANGLFITAGYFAYLFPLVMVYWAWQGFKHRFDITEPELGLMILRILGFILVMVAGSGLAAIHGNSMILPYGSGGLIGNTAAKTLVNMFSFTGATLLLFALFLTGITISTGFSWFALIDKAGQLTLTCCGFFRQRISNWRRSVDEDAPEIAAPKVELKKIGKRTLNRIEPEIHRQEVPKPPVVANKPVKVSAKVATSAGRVTEKSPDGSLPGLELLDPPEKPSGKGYSNEELERLSREVELRLQDFGIDVQVVAVHPGPVVTRFEMQLAAGVKVSRISGLAKDLARSLSAISVRIVEVIPGKSVVGLELPNRNREIVRLSEVFASQAYEQARSPLSLALGKDIAGHPVVVDLAKMPHLLVAGTTGSGKSVGMNAMLLSLLYKAAPSQVRMIMVDPKMLELSIYEGIPHLLTPVVTDMKEAANALRWCVAEMDRRYRLMAALGVRNLAGYNAKVQEAYQQNRPLLDPFWRAEQGGEPSELTELPYIVVLIDEFADMMMVVGKKVEELIARIAQKARAAGIHLILATQRPSVDVITGLIKANIPTRMAFQVSSKIDSRTILDQQGAEQLLGYGDMLYLAPGAGVPVRVHGAYVADHEVHAVVNFLKDQGPPDYISSITQTMEGYGESGAGEFSSSDEGEKDELYDQAVQIVIETRRASISGIQRRLKIGYNRAARLVEDMEKAGLVGPMESNGNREILLPANADD